MGFSFAGTVGTENDPGDGGAGPGLEEVEEGATRANLDVVCVCAQGDDVDGFARGCE